jgi:hypothetical protein
MILEGVTERLSRNISKEEHSSQDMAYLVVKSQMVIKNGVTILYANNRKVRLW